MSNYIFFVFFFYNYANEYRELLFIIIIHFHSTLLLLRHERLVKAVNLSLFYSGGRGSFTFVEDGAFLPDFFFKFT